MQGCLLYPAIVFGPMNGTLQKTKNHPVRGSRVLYDKQLTKN